MSGYECRVMGGLRRFVSFSMFIGLITMSGIMGR